jgi:hypothetical protein
MKESICKNCGTVFTHYPSDDRRYCSKSCYASHQKIWERTPTCNGGVTKGFTGRQHSEETKQRISASCKGKGRPTLPLIILKCKNCKEEFKVKRFKAERQFCSKKCQYEFIRTEKYCPVCNKLFYSSSLNTCSAKCRGMLQRSRVNKNCIQCGGDFQVIKKRESSAKFCCKDCKDIFQSGENNPAYVHGESNYPYPKEFSNGFKEKIRNKFNRKCFICGIDEDDCKFKLSVHHIDYNKDNCDEDNLVPLCRHCHSKTNSNRTYWEKVINISRGKIE